MAHLLTSASYSGQEAAVPTGPGVEDVYEHLGGGRLELRDVDHALHTVGAAVQPQVPAAGIPNLVRPLVA
jgi:hypothetical protein